MPKLLAVNEIKLAWEDIANRKPRKLTKPPKRSTGVHLSGVIQYCLGLDKDKDPDEMPLCMAVGMAWEEWMVGLWPEMIWQPGEMCKDGVYMTPDGKSKLPIDGVKRRVIEECKATWMSRRTHGVDITQETKFMWQLAGNCNGDKCNHARLHVLWVCGDYKSGPPIPSYCTYLLEFSDQELEKFWNGVVLKNKDCVKREVWE